MSIRVKLWSRFLQVQKEFDYQITFLHTIHNDVYVSVCFGSMTEYLKCKITTFCLFFVCSFVTQCTTTMSLFILSYFLCLLRSSGTSSLMIKAHQSLSEDSYPTNLSLDFLRSLGRCVYGPPSFKMFFSLLFYVSGYRPS